MFVSNYDYMISKILINNFKSIHNQEIELGRVNVFIGENGSGKSNILESIAMVSAAKSEDLKAESLFNKGVRVTKPSLTFNSFLGQTSKKSVKIEIFEDKLGFQTELHCNNPDDIYATWTDKGTNYTEGYLFEKFKRSLVKEIIGEFTEFVGVKYTGKEELKRIEEEISVKADKLIKDRSEKIIIREIANESITNYLIYNLNTNALRGISNESKVQPLGINGEGLDTLLSTFNEAQMSEIKKLNFISWLKDIYIDTESSFKLKGFKLGRSNSDLYFTDKYMQKKNNMFSAENANEGALHILFYLALFISDRTPNFFAIDNIETALNPMLCRQVIKNIVELAKKNNKQALITTHNPAVIDGLNLHDDEQRLFVIKRTDEGYTKIERIKVKPDANEKLKLSELWMRGYLGALPSNIF